MTYTNIVMHYPNIIILRYQMYNTEDEVKIILEKQYCTCCIQISYYTKKYYSILIKLLLKIYFDIFSG